MKDFAIEIRLEQGSNNCFKDFIQTQTCANNDFRTYSRTRTCAKNERHVRTHSNQYHLPIYYSIYYCYDHTN